MKRKFRLVPFVIIAVTFIMCGCGSSHGNKDVNQGVGLLQFDPNGIDKRIVSDFQNQSTHSTRESIGRAIAKLSVTRVPHSDSIALMLETNIRDIVGTEFFIDLDANTATGVQVNRVTNPSDQGMAKNGSVGADIILVNGVMYYYNLNRRHWRYWYHNWQLLDRVKFTRDPKHGRFIAKIPRNFVRFMNVRANIKPVQIHGSVEQYRGNLDFATVLSRSNGNIRVTVAMVTKSGNSIYLTKNVNFSRAIHTR